MTFNDFTKLVADMRHAQREYFRTRSPTALEASKRLEKAVDTALRDHDQGQRQMFPETTPNPRG